MRNWKKRFLALALSVVMTMGLLPGTAYAAVGDLLNNSPRQNERLLEQLEHFTGESYEEAYALLDSLGLLDEEGNLITDQTIDLDGEAYTLEELEALLSDPDTDLSQVAEVDGVPISLGDLQTIIAIERELQRIQEKYFSDRAFEGEAVDNLNSLMSQLQSQGIRLTSAGDPRAAGGAIADVSDFHSCNSGSDEVSTTIAAEAETTLSVDVSYDPGLAKLDSVTVTLGDQSATLTSDAPNKTLTAMADGNVTLSVKAGGTSSASDSNLYGDLTGAVHFTNPVGFVFRDGSAYTDAFTVTLVHNYKNMPNLSATMDMDGNAQGFSASNVTQFNWTSGIEVELDQNSLVQPMEELVQIVYAAKADQTGFISDYSVNLQMAQTNSENEGLTYYAVNGSTGFNDNRAIIPSPNTVTITSISEIDQSNYGGQLEPAQMNYMQDSTLYPLTVSAQAIQNDDGTFTVMDSFTLTYINIYGAFVTDPQPIAEIIVAFPSVSITLQNDGDDPECTSVSASGTYRTGQRVPILLEFNELVKVDQSGTVMNINGKDFTAADLWMSNTAGTSLLAWYPVQKSDNKGLSITSATGITDVFGNGVGLNTKVEGVTLESRILRFAPTGLTAGEYDEETGVTFTVDVDPAFDNSIANYDNGETAPFRVVVQDGTETYTSQVVIDTNKQFVTTEGIVIPRKQEDAAYTAILQVNMGTKDQPNWVDASWLNDSFTVPAYVNVDSVTVTADQSGVTELSLGGEYWPTLTAKVTGADGQTPTATSGTWESSDTDIATITAVEGNPLQATVSPTGKKVGPVTFTFTADNGTDDKDTDDRADSVTYTVVAGDSPALNIPTNSSTIVTRKNAAATVIWSSNAGHFVDGKAFQFTVKLYEGYAQTEADLNGKTLVDTYSADSQANSLEIPANTLENLSENGIPAYTVRVSMPHPNVSDDSIELSALAWIVVYPVPAKAVLTPPTSLYLKDTDGTVDISWAVENRDEEAEGQSVNLTILRVQEDNSPSTVCNETLQGSSGDYVLDLSQYPVQANYLKDTYQVMLTVTNVGGDAPSTDSFPLYVYNGDALKIQDGEGKDVDSISLDNTSRVDGTSGKLPTGTGDIMELRQQLGLMEYVSINHGEYNWNTYLDGIKWATDNDDVVSVNYKQGGLYENISLFGDQTYLPGTTMALSSTVDGTATITATHAKTGMSDTVMVDVTTLRNKFYLFQVSPAQETTLRYVDGKGEEQTPTTNEQGVLALYEPNGIASNVWLSSGNVWQNDEYMGTIYQQDLQSGEQDATMLQLYPLNTTTLRQAAKVDLTLLKPDGSPLADTEVTLRGGVFKNGYYCETSGIGKDRSSMNGGGPDQADVTVTTNENGEITVYFDATQFWSAAAGENKDTPLLSTDQIQYVLEIRNIDNDAYYPVFQTVDASVSIEQEMHNASGVVVLESVDNSEKNKPFVAHQIVDYGLDNGRVLDVRQSTGRAGPTEAYPTGELVTTMFLWGTGGSGNYELRITDENGYVPAAQTSTAGRYPFTSIPVVENTLTLSAEALTDSGWIPEGKDTGVKARLTAGGSLVRELTLPFRVMDLTTVPPVDESDNVTQMLVTLTESSNVADAAFDGRGNEIMGGVSGVLNGLSEHSVNSSVFKMIITPTNDPTVFDALIWGGKDKLGLEELEYEEGISYQTNYLEGEFDVSRPGRSDLSQMAQGTYIGNTIQENVKMSSSDMEFKYQLTGYYEAQIRYNLEKGEWEIFTTGGGFTAGVGMGIGFTVNTMVGPVPVTASFGVGGAIQLDFQTAVRYSQQGNNVWSDPDATAVNDYLTNLRIVAYVNAFGGVGFDFSVIALKIGLYGELNVDSQNRFLSRPYLKNAGDQQINGQFLQTSGEVGIKFVAKFLFVSYETNLVSAGFTTGASFGNWGTIDDYWNDATAGLSLQSLSRMAARSGLQVASASATLQSLDYLETYARTWGQPQARIALFALDDPSVLGSLQTNANPGSYPELSGDGQILVYISDGYDDTENPDPSIYDSRAHFSKLSGGSYSDSAAIADPAGFTGYGDSDVDIAGSGSFAAAAWVRMSERLPEKDEGDEVTVEEQNLLMNGTEIVASVYAGADWTSQRLTANATPDLAPAVASNVDDRAVVFWRSVYSGTPDELLSFTTRDSILYSVYEKGSWSEAKTLYNGSNGSVKALEAAMLPDGTAVAVYTLDKSGKGDTTQYEVGYTIVNADNSLGHSMLTTSDSYLDENPQVVAASFGTDDNRFVIAWHSIRDGISDIQLLAVDEDGAMSNSFPASLAEITTDGSAAVSSSFRLAALSGSYTDVTNLTVIWDETVENHSVLQAARLRSNGGTGYVLSAPMELATLEARTMADHFEAYVSGENQVKAVIQATQYSDISSNITADALENDIPQTKLYTATSDFALDAVEVEAIVPDYENLALGSLVAVQFVIRNTGLNNVTGLTVNMADGATAALEDTLLPNQSATLTVMHQIDDTVEDASYTVTANNSAIRETGPVYLDYPDIGISRMEVVKEEAGKRTISMTLYNASPATLAGGNKDRTVKLAFYTDNTLTTAASGIESLTGGVEIGSGAGETHILTISGADALERIDAGSFTLEFTYDVGSYVKGQGLDEIPSEGVYLFADLWTEGKVGGQEDVQRLPEYRSANNQENLWLTGALARTGKSTTLNTDLSADSSGNTVATVTLKNNSLRTYKGTKLAATLLDANGSPLETQVTTILDKLDGETSSTSTVTFSQPGSRVVVTAYTPDEDVLTFEGLPVSLSDFVQAADESGQPLSNQYEYTLSGVTASSTLVTVYPGDGTQAVSVNGQALKSGSDNGGSVTVSIRAPETAIQVVIGNKTYTLYLTDIPTSGGGGGSSVTRYAVNLPDEVDNGEISASPTRASRGQRVTLTVTPDEGYVLDTLTVTDRNGKAVTLRDAGDGKYTFSMPGSPVDVAVSFRAEDEAGLPFLDVAEGSWYYDAVSYVYEHGLMTGTSGTAFAPDANLTRAMMATVLWAMEGSPVVNYAMTYTDVSGGAWYAEAVRWATSEGVVSGVGDNRFDPDAPITREQMAVMLYAYAAHKGYDTDHNSAEARTFHDYDAISGWALTAMEWAVDAGLIGGKPGNILDPAGTATRAEVATILRNFHQTFEA